MAGRAILSLVNGKRLREQRCQSTWMMATNSNLTQETHVDNQRLGDVETNGSHMPPCPTFATQLGVVETKSLEIVDHTIGKSDEAVGCNGTTQYPSGEGTSNSHPPLPLPKWMTTESSPRREDIQKGVFVESSSSKSLATTTTKAVEMDWTKLPTWVNIVGSSSRRFESKYDDIDLELGLTCSSRLNDTDTGKLLEDVERPEPKSSLTFNLDDINDDGPIANRDANVKRLKLFGKIIETSSVQAAPNRRGDNESMPIEIDNSDDEADCPSVYVRLRRLLFGGAKVFKKPEGVGPLDDEEQRRPSVGAVALRGRALLNDDQKSCEVEKRGASTVWKT